eukprot:TRINITY_DN17785_c0_g1_i1.p1 TRINITY_DN17785_c0_g1~~TRINITY_DN17785_c0_g1_i1.p1  ORF type:complete len:787 (-),score=130.23 TRINITY_DN17785_c0_g1_i1:213-2573(-)
MPPGASAGKPSDYDFAAQLGRGSFGVVHRVKRIRDGRAFVCKTIELKGMSNKARTEANMEVSLLRKVSSGSDYIVQYIDSFVARETLYIVMEFCENGDLSQYLKGRGGVLVPERTVFKFLIQIALGLRWLHANRVLHRDMKTLNVFLTSADDVRLGDLGVARVLSHNTNFASTFVGTPYYLSPELCEEKPYNEKSDVWAYGCVVYEMCALKHPFEAKNHGALIIKILRGMYAPIHSDYSDDLRDVVDACMQREYAMRPTTSELLARRVVRDWASRLSIDLPAIACKAEAAPPGDDDDLYEDEGESLISHTARQVKPSSRPPRAEPVATRNLLARPGGQRPPSGGVVPMRRPSSDGAVAGRARVRGGAQAARRQENAGPVQVISAPGVKPPGMPLRGGEGPGPPRVRKSCAASAASEAAIAEKRRAAAMREVAELPERVVPKAGPKNVPTIHQFAGLDSTASSVSSVASMEQTINPDESTLRPPEREVRSPDPGLPPPLPSLRVLKKIDPAPSDDDQSPAESNDMHSVGNGTVDSLAYTADDSLAYTGTNAALGITSGMTDAVVTWNVTAAISDGLEEELPEDDVPSPLKLSAALDSNGLLCDAQWHRSPSKASGRVSEDEVEENIEIEEDEEDVDDIADDPTEIREESELMAEQQVEECTLPPPSTPPPPEADVSDSSPATAAKKLDQRLLLERQIKKVGSQIQRAYADVSKQLDEPARAVWDDLHSLFQQKMAMASELTDDDQSDIERYVFENLPTESTDLIWTVYKVLHLEQERDRFRRRLEEL